MVQSLSGTLSPVDERHKRLLLHLKCLFWCLHEMQVQYDLNLAIYSLERHTLHPALADSNLGDNLAFLIEHLGEGDLARVRSAVSHVRESIGSRDIANKHFELGHYIQSTHSSGPVAAGSYGVIVAISPQLRGLFCLEGGHLIESSFEPSGVRTIFGTYIV